MRVTREDGYEIDIDPGRLDAELVCHWLSTDAYWAAGRSRATIERSMRASVNFGVYGADGAQVAYARVVTDLATFAWLCDVYIDRGHRGTGLGTWLVSVVRDYLVGHHVGRVMLVTLDAHEVYAKVGFVPLAEPDQFMALGAGPGLGAVGRAPEIGR